MATATRLPESHRVLQLESMEQPLQFKTVPTLQPGPGSAVVQVLAAAVIFYSGDLYNGKRQYPSQWFPAAPQSGGSPPPDPTQRHWRRASWFSSSDFNDASAKLMHGEWRNSTYAQYCKFPLENCIPLNETRLLGDPSARGLGYRVEDLTQIFRLLVPYGVLDDIGLKPGEAIIIAPATSQFSSVAVRVVLAMAAGRVIAMGRNEVAWKQLRELDGCVSTFKITGDMEADAAALRTWGLTDVFFEISPPMAAGSTHFRSGIAALRNGGRISLMGGLPSDVSFAYEDFMVRGLSMKGTWIYTREQIDDFLRLVESGLLSLSKRGGLRVGATFGLEQWREAFEAAKVAQTDETVAIRPWEL
ncbi:hypothetical protein IWZ03DRAFT_422165 [Phyllosticta citriasiana]|uniref:Alcohol dehydrogenase-like C-terminal domain-containing protein n=1 Tax=Phyllosticta citriasiana TaxID=595635 RepID=A0ABR1KTP0_9PEZI